MSKWSEAQGLAEYNVYLDARSRQAAREAAIDTLRAGGFDAELLASKGTPITKIPRTNHPNTKEKP